MALEDWITPASDLISAWRGSQQAASPFTPLNYASSTPTILAPAAGQMGDNGTWLPGGRCKRRRRQRNILTQANIGIMWQISSLPNNANVRIALAKAIR